MTGELIGYSTSYLAMFGVESADTDEGNLHITSVEIPLVQRDYAQGRTNAKVSDIRNAFLEVICDAIRGGPQIELDFVYGSVEEGVLRPLDGQQRLTTLFLIHWYLAVRTRRPRGGESWLNFTYATRPSARRFCEQLARSSPELASTVPSEWITDQHWFQYGWEFDPTIQSMLVVLDQIHEILGGANHEEAWRRLSDATNTAVTFHVLEIDEVGQGDELYIKMNSRGKMLTEFENFKAHLEQILSHSVRGEHIAHKIDGSWSDFLWPYHGGDHLVDDEFMRYFDFVMEVCEWVNDIPRAPVDHKRAEAIFGSESKARDASIEFLEQAFDIWVDLDIAEFFKSVLRTAKDEKLNDAPVIFPRGLQGANLLRHCLRTYGDVPAQRNRPFSLGLIILLYAVIVHRIHNTDDVRTRLRSLRNLVEASDDEIRSDRMGALLRATERLMRTGDLENLAPFNHQQADDELRKAKFYRTNPECAEAMYALEDHPILRGCLQAFDLEPDKLELRSATLIDIFSTPTVWPSLTGALLTCGDYYRAAWRNGYKFLFGSPSHETYWRDLLTGPAASPIRKVTKPLAKLLDRLADRSDDISAELTRMTSDWVDEREREQNYDWRYYMVKYPVVRGGESGIFVSASADMGYELCALRRKQLNSNYRDALLHAIFVEAGSPSSDVYDPWFTGREYLERWMETRRHGVEIRNDPYGLEIYVPDTAPESVRDYLAGQVGIDQEPGDEERAAHPGKYYSWMSSFRAHAQDGDETDGADRVRVGAEILTGLIAAGA